MALVLLPARLRPRFSVVVGLLAGLVMPAAYPTSSRAEWEPPLYPDPESPLNEHGYPKFLRTNGTVVPNAYSPGAGRAMAWDERVERVAVSPEVSLELPRGSKKPPVGETKQPMMAGGTLQRAPRHFKDWYFVVLDLARTDVSSADAIAALADEISASSGAKRVGGEFVKPPQGFRVSGTEEAALQIARDARVVRVEEVGPYLRATDPRPGEYWVAFRKAADAPSGEPALRRLAEGLAEAYGGRIAHLWMFGGFTLADMAEESARALSEDPGVEYVEENCCVGPATEPLSTPVVDTTSPGPGAAVDGRAGALSLRRASRHFRDHYFVALDEIRVDVGTWEGLSSETWQNRAAMEAVAYELTAGTDLERVGPSFVRPPQGFQVAGSEAEVLELARDPRVKWVEEVGTLLRALEARPGEYGVVLQRSAFGKVRVHRGDVRRVAEDLVRRYGGRVTKHIWESALLGFGLENASEESARAMSEDPRVEFVEENPAGSFGVPTPKVDIDRTP